ncbi:MAG: universal stress protein [SAR324 cluster bacterium]|nr:universal stress protein [SAR324 cluster bacterium]
MEKRILVPIDYSQVCEEVVTLADEWAQRSNADLHFLRVDADYMENGDVDRDFFEKRFQQFLQNFNVTTPYQTSLRFGTSYVEIMEAVKELEPDLVIMAAHSHTLLGRIFLGSNTDYVLHHCDCPVFVHKQNPMGFANKIIVPVDYSEVNKAVIRIADDWAQRTDSELYFIHTEPVPEYGEGQYAMESGFYQEGDEISVAEEDEREMTDACNELKQKFENYVLSLQVKSLYQFFFEFGKPYLKIKDLQTETGAGLIMMAAHSHTLLNRLFVGSNTDYLLHHLNCPMYIYKAGES